jgi:hypothetical protein
MKKSILKKTLIIAATLPMLAGCVVYERPARPVAVVQPAPPPGGEVVVENPSEPPPPQVEVVPVAPDPAFIWIGGAWEWRAGWVWVGGHWGPRPHPGAVWVRGGWARHRHGYVWVGAHWR